ncbi:MAG TPA: hypothetical protein VEL11_19355 [Candidatus Bathyarchaeia archaeon]|nr:hypothetical protein [Candidatus Bathyarchaeia archaeon]
MEAEKYFEDAVAQCGTIPDVGEPNIISKSEAENIKHASIHVTEVHLLISSLNDRGKDTPIKILDLKTRKHLYNTSTL